MLKTRVVLILKLVLLLPACLLAQFTECADANYTDALKSSLCATLKTPLYHQEGDNKTIDLFVRKFPSVKEKKGSLWLLSGGPGESGASLYPLVPMFAKMFPHLDIFIPDHRGTGLSGKICPEEEGIDSPNGIALANNEWGPCYNYMYSHPAYVQAFSITNAAKDYNRIINELSGDGKRYVYGVSYGTQLILRMLQLGSLQVDKVILDSMVPLQNDSEYDLSKRSFVTDDVGRSFLSNRGIADSGTSLITEMQSVLKRAKQDTVFAKNLPKQKLSVIFGMMLDLPKVRNQIPNILKALANNDFAPLNSAVDDISTFYQAYGAYPTSPSSIPLVQVITASENNLRPQLTKNEALAESEDLLFTSNLPYLMAENATPVYEPDAYFGKIPENMPPTLIIHGTLDSKTHYKGTIRHYKALSKKSEHVQWVPVKNAPHFIALFAPKSFVAAATAFIQGEPVENKPIYDKEVLLN